jgi:hypothetical protein
MSLKGTQSLGPITVRGGGLRLLDANANLQTLGPLKGAELQCASVTLTQAQAQALNTAPVTLVAAPGTGKVLLFHDALIADPAGTAFGTAAGRDLVVRYTDGSGTVVSTQLTTVGFTDQTTTQIRTLKCLTTDISPTANAALVLHQLAANMTLGQPGIVLTVRYFIVDTGV